MRGEKNKREEETKICRVLDRLVGQKKKKTSLSMKITEEKEKSIRERTSK